SRPAAVPPDFPEHSAVLTGDLFEAEWMATLASLKPSGVEAILRPGVDGDVIGVLCSSPELRAQLEDSLRTSAAGCGLAVQLVPEHEFAASLFTATDDRN